MNKKAIVKELKKKDWKNIQSPLGSKGKRKFAQMLKTIEKTEQYKCQSYYDDENILQDCTCGKCGSIKSTMTGKGKVSMKPKEPDKHGHLWNDKDVPTLDDDGEYACYAKCSKCEAIENTDESMQDCNPTPPIPEEWEKQFDKRYNFERQFKGDELSGLQLLHKDIKDFIRKLLTQKEQAIKDYIVVKNYEIARDLVENYQGESLKGMWVIVAPKGLKFVSKEDIAKLPQVKDLLTQKEQSVVESIREYQKRYASNGEMRDKVVFFAILSLISYLTHQEKGES